MEVFLYENYRMDNYTCTCNIGFILKTTPIDEMRHIGFKLENIKDKITTLIAFM